VQRAGIFEDSKEFVDMPLKFDPEDVLEVRTVHWIWKTTRTKKNAIHATSPLTNPSIFNPIPPTPAYSDSTP
jgi:hypothetical protein